MPITLILQIIFRLPSLLKTGMAILKLLKDLKGQSIPEVVGTAIEILKLILEIAPNDKTKAKELMGELHATLKPQDGMVSGGRTHLEKLKDLQRRCNGIGCTPELKTLD